MIAGGDQPLPTEIVERLRCIDCGQAVAPVLGGLGCPSGHLMAVHDGYLDASPHQQASLATQATLRSFGYEWTRFPKILPEDDTYWKWYFADVDLARLAGRVGLDAGCGKGRYSVFTARHLAGLVALDGSDAVEAAVANLAGSPNTVVVRADLRRLPLAPGSFGFVSCLGVLHHLEDPQSGFQDLMELLAPGGIVLVYLYSRPGRVGLRALGLGAAAALRRLTVGVPAPALRVLCWPIALALWLAVVRPGAAASRRRQGYSSLPLAAYHGKPMRSLWLDTFDRLSAPIEHRYSWDEVRPWFDSAGLVVDAVREESGLFIVGHRP